MNPLILYIFMLLAAPRQMVLCTLWISQNPTGAELTSACPSTDLQGYNLRAVDLWDDQTYCDRPAADVYQVGTVCALPSPLDHYRIEIYNPQPQRELLCAVQVFTPQPNYSDIREQCGLQAADDWQAGIDTLLANGTKTIGGNPAPMCQPPTPATGPGMQDQPESAADLATSHDLYLLAGRLLWNGYASPTACQDGTSGVDTGSGAATTCGMDSARQAMIAWQNRYDNEIYNAALRHNVPARLIKQLVESETQFWPWTGTDGESGLVQITGDGIDLALNWTMDGYAALPVARRADARYLVRQQLVCDGCSLWQRAEAARANFDFYAQALAGYYCATGSWDAALTLWNIKHAGMAN